MKIRDLIKEDVRKLREAPVGPPPPIHTVPDYRIQPPQQFSQPQQPPASAAIPPPIHTVPDYRQPQQAPQQAPQRPYVWQIQDPVSQLMRTTQSDPRVAQQTAQIAQQLSQIPAQGVQSWQAQLDPATGQTSLSATPEEIAQQVAADQARQPQPGPQPFGQVGDPGITFPAAQGVLPWANQQAQGSQMSPQQMQQHLGVAVPSASPAPPVQGAQSTLGPDDETGVFSRPDVQVAHKIPTMRELAKHRRS